MEILRIVLTVLFVIDCIGLTVIILMQEGKSQGLGSIAGMAETYDHGHFVFRAGFSIKSEFLRTRLLH